MESHCLGLPMMRESISCNGAVPQVVLLASTSSLINHIVIFWSTPPLLAFMYITVVAPATSRRLLVGVQRTITEWTKWVGANSRLLDSSRVLARQTVYWQLLCRSSN